MNKSSGSRKRAIATESDIPDRFVLYVKLPTLQEMAAYEAARSIWYSYVSTHSRPKVPEDDEYDGEYHEDQMQKSLGLDEGYSRACDRRVKSLKLPTSIEKLLEKTLAAIRKETKSWIEGCQFRSYEEFEECFHIGRFDLNWCVWWPNGLIDLPKTGLKMLASGQLTLEQRFAILSEFCMVEELEKFPWRSLNASFVGSFSGLNETYLMYYWIHYLKKKLHKIPTYPFHSLDAWMAERCEVEHCKAFQYFFNRVPDDEKVSVAVRRFKNLHSRTHQDHCLSRLSWKHQKQLMSKVPEHMMMKFWIFMRSPEAAMWVWRHSKDVMTPEQFDTVVQMVFPRKVDSEDDCRLILEMWRSASDRQRNFVVRSKGEHIIKPFITKTSHSKAAFEFLYEFSSATSEDFRRQTLLKNAAQLGAHVQDDNSMQKIVQLCLPNSADQQKYKRLAKKSGYMESPCQNGIQ